MVPWDLPQVIDGMGSEYETDRSDEYILSRVGVLTNGDTFKSRLVELPNDYYFSYILNHKYTELFTLTYS